jgi:hypothetical protein
MVSENQADIAAARRAIAKWRRQHAVLLSASAESDLEENIRKSIAYRRAKFSKRSFKTRLP